MCFQKDFIHYVYCAKLGGFLLYFREKKSHDHFDILERQSGCWEKSGLQGGCSHPGRVFRSLLPWSRHKTRWLGLGRQVGPWKEVGLELYFKVTADKTCWWFGYGCEKKREAEGDSKDLGLSIWVQGTSQGMRRLGMEVAEALFLGSDCCWVSWTVNLETHRDGDQILKCREAAEAWKSFSSVSLPLGCPRPCLPNFSINWKKKSCRGWSTNVPLLKDVNTLDQLFP